MRNILRDIQFAGRLMGRSLGLTVVAILTLALGIGTTAAVFSLVNAVLLRPLPYRAPEDLVLVQGSKKGDTVETWPISYLDLTDWRQRLGSFESLAAVTDRRSFKLRRPEGAELVFGEMVSANYFEVLGLQPKLGRGFLPDEEKHPGGDRVAVLSHDLWLRLFGGNQQAQEAQGALGRTIELNEIPYTVIGVMPQGFRGMTDEAEVWLPISMASTLGPAYLTDRSFRWLQAVGRLRPSGTAGRAENDLAEVALQLEREHPDTNQGIGATLKPLREALFGDLRPILWTLLGGSAFVLLIGCTNIANLLLARAVHRQREICLRAALGASRTRIMRQLLTESMLLGLVGCTLGLAVAWLSVGFLVRLSGLHLMSFVDIRFDPLVVGTIVVVSILAGVLFGLAPAFLASRSDANGLLKEGGTGTTKGAGSYRIQNTLVVAEVALALILLVGAGLMIKAFREMSGVNLGFRAERLLTLRVNTQGQRLSTDDSFRQMVRDLTARVAALPGVESVAVGGPDMPTDDWYGAYYTLEGHEAADGQGLVFALRHHVTPGYFSTLGVPLLRGRIFTPQDVDPANGVVVVSQSMAERFWPGQDPLGKRLKIGPPGFEAPWLAVVGVVRDVRHNGLSDVERPAPDVYLPVLQFVPRTPPVLNLLVRTRVAPGSLVNTIQREVKAFAPDLPLYDIQGMEERLSRQTTGRQFLVLVMTLFSLSALSLAAIGIYGVISYVVSQRTREFGIRMALGAQVSDVVRNVLGRALFLAMVGISLGLLGALALTRLIEARLYGANALDGMILGGASLLLLAVALAANYIPVRRATKVSPVSALRAG
jgi:putative ABC transport system permease protein